MNHEKQHLLNKIEKLQADLQLADRNAINNLEDQKEQQKDQLKRMLVDPLGSLRRDVQNNLANPNEETAINVRVSFATLERRINRLLR